MALQEEWDDILIYLASQHSLDLARTRLEKVSGPWPLDLPQLKRTLELASLQGLQELLLLHLVTRVLLAGRKAPGWLKGWLRRQEVLKGVAPELSFKTALSMDWSAVPVPVVGIDGRGGVFRMMLAIRPEGRGVAMPPWARESLDSECPEGGCPQAISHAVNAAQNQGLLGAREVGFYCWPLLDPTGPPVRGESLGLPFAMALSLLVKGVAWPASLMATGGMGDQGEVRPVGGVRAKVQAAAESEITLFLYPTEEEIDFTEWPIPALPVSDLGQAMTFAQLMALGLPSVSNFRLYYSCLQDANLMLDNFHQLPPSVLLWSRDHGLLRQVKDLSQTTEGFTRLVSRFSDNTLNVQHREILVSLFNEDDLAALAARSSQDALMVSNWYQGLRALANGLGTADRTKRRKRKAHKIFREFGNKIYLFYRTEDHHACYQRFDQDFERCLRAMKGGPVKKHVLRAWNEKLVYIHLPVKRGDDISARVFFSEDNHVMALSLNALNLDIDPETGDAQFIDDCVYAIYLGLIRATFVINQDKLSAEFQLNALLTDYLYRLVWEFIESVCWEKGDRAERKNQLREVCDYYYAACFLGLDQKQAVSWRKGPGRRVDVPGTNLRSRIIPLKCDKRGRAKKFSEILASAGLTPHHNWLWHRLVSDFSREALYALNGVLDHFIGLCILSSYPTNLFEGRLPAAARISKQVEAILLPYLEQIKYSTSSATQGR